MATTENTTENTTIADAVEAAGVSCAEQVCDALIALATRGGDWRAELAGAVARDGAERRRLRIE